LVPSQTGFVDEAPHLTHAAIAGAVVTLTGFGPEHWFADLFAHLSTPESIRHS
jgi:hypothetical protein